MGGKTLSETNSHWGKTSTANPTTQMSTQTVDTREKEDAGGDCKKMTRAGQSKTEGRSPGVSKPPS